MEFKIKGKVSVIGETKEFGSNGFTKREVIVDTSRNPSYPNPVSITFKKDDCAKADSFLVGDYVEVEGWIEGREWNGPNGTKYFTTLAAKTVVVEKRAKEVNADDPKAVRDWETLLAFAKVRGMNEEEVKEVGRKYCEKYGVSSKDLVASNWVAIAGAVEDARKAEEAKAMAAAQDDMPF